MSKLAARAWKNSSSWWLCNSGTGTSVMPLNTVLRRRLPEASKPCFGSAGLCSSTKLPFLAADKPTRFSKHMILCLILSVRSRSHLSIMLAMPCRYPSLPTSISVSSGGPCDARQCRFTRRAEWRTGSSRKPVISDSVNALARLLALALLGGGAAPGPLPLAFGGGGLGKEPRGERGPGGGAGAFALPRRLTPLATATPSSSTSPL
mmetsp:Transcript_50637/g.120837  ORF Transcript_50637/g.120837 Transcript_50637/m.120837 type:complete len:206 (+) Transcript_50637:1853-2470(+)